MTLYFEVTTIKVESREEKRAQDADGKKQRWMVSL